MFKTDYNNRLTVVSWQNCSRMLGFYWQYCLTLFYIFSTVTTLSGLISSFLQTFWRESDLKQQLKSSRPMASCYIAAPISSPSGTPEHQTSLLNPEAEVCRDPHSQKGAATPGMEKRSVALSNLKMVKVKVLPLFLTSRMNWSFPWLESLCSFRRLEASDPSAASRMVSRRHMHRWPEH